MPVKLIAELVRGLFGVSGTDRAEESETETNVTVERETGDGSGTREEATDADSDTPVAEPETGDGAVDPTDEASATGASVEEITGIGPTYGDRLSGAGFETVGDLVGAEAEAVATAAEVSESRAADWITQAEDSQKD